MFSGIGGDYLNFTQNEENSAKSNFDWLAKWYSQFNPQAPQVQPINATPAFSQAADNTKGFLNALTGGLNPGNFDYAGTNKEIENTAGNEAARSNLDSALSAMNQNAKETQGTGISNFERMNKISDTENKINQLPSERIGADIQVQDAIKQMEQNYKNSQDPIGNILGGILGSGLGTFAGSRLFASNLPSLPGGTAGANTGGTYGGV